MNITEREELLPLTPTALYILLSLAGGQRYGYEIQACIRADSKGVIEVATGTLYPALKRLAESGIIISVTPQARVKVYKLSKLGRQLLAVELERMLNAVTLGRARL